MEYLKIFYEVATIFANKIILAVGAIISFVFFITGGQDKMITCLLIVISIDYVSGYIKSYVIKKTNSRKGWIGILKKIMMILVVVLAHQVDILLDGKFAVRLLTISLLISNEGLSILENAAICGCPIPEKLKNILEQYRESKK